MPDAESAVEDGNTSDVKPHGSRSSSANNHVEHHDGSNGSAANEAGSKPPPRKRRRIVISCTECHRRKQKCDRKLPCTNCTSRGKESSCRYETGTPLAKDQDRVKTANGHHINNIPEQGSPAENMPMKAADFGYAQNGASTLGFLQKIEGASGQPLTGITTETQEGDHFASRERYKSLIRHLPARMFVEQLISIYFKEFNTMYYALDEVMFNEQVAAWYNLPYNVLSTAGPQAIEPSLRSFPALVFQVLATALLAIPTEADETFSSLKYAGNMTFEDIAIEYSETGMALLSLLGKRQMTMSTVLAGWMRAGFLKYTGQVTEAWHQVGTAVRDAQEIGLHRDQFDPIPNPNDSTEKTLEAMWEAEHRRRLWMILVVWDLHTGAVLGRPTSVDYRPLKRSLPIDAQIPKDRRKTPIYPRGEDDPPTPLTRALWTFEIMKPLREILDLEKEGPFPKDFSKVEKIHQDLLDLQARMPAALRLDNPDTRYDDLPECWWLKMMRPTLPQTLSFNFMALHRPYIFTRASSRYEALKASLAMLEAQRYQFAALSPHQYKTFSLFFGTFDAIVMVASIYILFPKEHPELLSSALQHFQWGVLRFETMAARNRLAHAALSVLNAIYIRLKKAMGHGFLDGTCPASFTCPQNDPELQAICARMNRSKTSEVANTPASSSVAASSEPTTAPSVSNSSSYQSNHPSVPSTAGSVSTTSGHYPSSSDYTASAASTNTLANTDPALFSHQDSSAAAAAAAASSDWPFPTDFDFSSLPPMYPMGDVAYNDLQGFRDDGSGVSGAGAVPGITAGVGAGGAHGGGMWGAAASNPGTAMDGVTGSDEAVAAAAAMAGMGAGADEVPWQFGGDFGNDTIWNLLNQFPPY
ncbi:fungal specific transcription factor domain-containing protein [Apiospora rasikravindrae]|uniref:Fungal specific transcription factor domain-containing protein n=1 Tax=Apiospora rasikravindrae TaxID=990691 RepID=A0ABR1SXA6_9PEZI